VKDYNDHISEISNKLVAIMDSMLEMNISKVRLGYYIRMSLIFLCNCIKPPGILTRKPLSLF